MIRFFSVLDFQLWKHNLFFISSLSHFLFLNLICATCDRWMHNNKLSHRRSSLEQNIWKCYALKTPQQQLNSKTKNTLMVIIIYILQPPNHLNAFSHLMLYLVLSLNVPRSSWLYSKKHYLVFVTYIEYSKSVPFWPPKCLVFCEHASKLN